MSVNDDSSRVSDASQLPEFPAEFWSWPEQAQVEWIAHSKTRRTLVTQLLIMSNVDLQARGDDDDPRVQRQEYLTEKDLAAIYRTMRDMNRERSG